MSANVLEGMTDLQRQIEQFGNIIKGGLAAVHENPEHNAISFFENETEEVPMVPGKLNKANMRRGRGKLRIKGYKQDRFKSFSDYIRTGFKNKSEFEQKQAESISELQKANALNSLDSESASSLILPQYAPDIMSIMYDNDIIGRTQQYTVTGNSMEFPKCQEASRANGSRFNGLQSYWVEESDLMTASKPKIGSTALKLRKLVIIVYLTQELIDDNSYALEAWVRRAVQAELAFMIVIRCSTNRRWNASWLP